MADIRTFIDRFSQLKIQRGFSFARNTTIGCGGYAELAVYPDSTECAVEVLDFLDQKRISYVILGAGANVLPGDGIFEGVVVYIGNKRLDSDGEYLHVGAGVTGGALCRFARKCGISGFEPFTGIPMTIGGGITMNAGVMGGHFSDVVIRVKAYEKGKVKILSLKDCNFSEKKSLFQDGIAVLEATLKGNFLAQEKIWERTSYFQARRKGLPKGRSMGCTFVNPEGISAGKLIEDCNLKGFRIGGAKISEQHANFIINEGATSKEIESLIRIAKDRVYERTGISLREEIRRIGQTT